MSIVTESDTFYLCASYFLKNQQEEVVAEIRSALSGFFAFKLSVLKNLQHSSTHETCHDFFIIILNNVYRKQS